MLPLKTVFMGTPKIASRSLLDMLMFQENGIVDLQAVYTKSPVWDSKKKEYIESPVEKIARENRIDLRTPKTFKNNREETDFLKTLAPDVIIVVAFGLILTPDILNIPVYGVLNLHPSLLPDLRGPSPIHYTILKMMKFGGVTIMAMNEGIDTGPLAAQQRIALDKNENFSGLYEKLSLAGSLLLSGVVETVYKHRINFFECGYGQDLAKKEGNRAHDLTALIKQEELRIDFSKDEPAVIYAKIRAFSEAGGAFFILKNKNVKILEAKLIVDDACEKTEIESGKTKNGVQHETFEYSDYCGGFSDIYKKEIEKVFSKSDIIAAGTAVVANKTGLLISTVKKGVYIRLIKLKPEGRNVMDYNDIVNGFRIKQGDLICP